MNEMDFLQSKKVVMLEELASHFDLRVQEAIQRLEDLQEMGRLTGIDISFQLFGKCNN